MSLYLPATCDSGWKSIFRVVSRLVLPSHNTGHISARPGHCSALYGFYWSVNSLHKVNSNSNVENLLKEGRDMTWNINNALKLDLRFLPHLLRLCKVQLEYFDFLWNYFQSTLFPLPRGFLEWETTWITKLKKVKGFWSFTFKSSTWLKELDLLLRCCLLYVGLHILILTDQHSGSPAMVDNEHWGTISNPRNLALKVEEEWGSLVYNPQLFIIK